MAYRRLTNLILSGMRYTVDELADKYTGRKLFDIMKSINKHKAAVNAHLKESPVKGAKTADSLVKKVAQAKNKKLLDALAAVNKKIRGRTNKQIENLIKEQKADKTLVDDSFKHHVATRPSKKDVASTHRKISTSRFKKGGTITKRKKGGKVGSGSAFVASLYK